MLLLLNRIRKDIIADDATELLTLCRLAKDDNSSFKYAFTLDDQIG